MGKGRAPCCDKTQVKRGPWSPEEDLKLITFIHKHGHENWRALPKLAGLVRCGKSCRLRWINYLRPDVKRGNFTIEEEETVIRLHKALGNKWSKIASHLPGRTDNEIKNVWNTHLKKRLPKLQESSTTFSSDSLISSNGSEYNNNEQASPVTVAEKQVSDDELNGIIIPEDQKESPTSFSSIDSNLSNSTYIVNYEPEEQMGNSILDELLEIPMESDYDIWNMLDNSGSLIQSNLREEIGVEDDAEKRKWFNDLENELGLGAIDLENQDDAAEQVMKKSELLDSDMGLAFLESSWPSWP